MSLKKGLGMGLGALMGNAEDEVNLGSQNILEIDINKIEPNKNQPRKNFDDEDLSELATSIKEFGIIQPLIVQDEGNYYSIVAGERRWRAARLAKLAFLPVIIKTYNDMEVLQVALIENIQRKDLNPIEEANSYKKLMDLYFFTQDDIGKKVGKSNVSISNTLSLLNLDKRVQNFVLQNKLSATTARLLLQISDNDAQYEIADNIVDNNLSGSDITSLISEYINLEKQPKEDRIVEQKRISSEHVEVIKDLRSILGTSVNIKQGKLKSKIEIEFKDNEELDRLLCLIKKIN